MESNIEKVNEWANTNQHNWDLSEKVFIAKNIYFICSSSKSVDEYENIFETMLNEFDGDILKFLDLFRGEKTEEDGKKYYTIYYKISEIEEEVVAMLDITNLNSNEPTTIN